MEEAGSEVTAKTSISRSSSTSPSPTSSPAPPPPPAVVLSPCAACKILRRRCVLEKCVLAPYFPPSDPVKFTIAHRVFGACNIIKMLKELPESHRADAVSSMVYEANARIRDPVYGSAGAICQLQKQVGELEAQLARARAELVTMQAQHDNLVAVIWSEMAHSGQRYSSPSTPGGFAAGSPSLLISNDDPYSAEKNVQAPVYEYELPLWA